MKIFCIAQFSPKHNSLFDNIATFTEQDDVLIKLLGYGCFEQLAPG